MDSIDWRTFPSLSALRALEATARTGGFTAAGQILNVTHAAVSQQVRSLEEHLGFALVVRAGRNVTLTGEGRQLADAANDGFSAIARALDGLRAARSETSLRITTTPAFAERWLVPRLKGFWSSHPDIAVTLRPDYRPLDLRREGIDLAIRYGTGNWAGMEATYLVSARFVVVGSPALLGSKTDLSKEDMARLPWVDEEGSAEQKAWLVGHGIVPATPPVAELPYEDLALTAARQGIGLFVAAAAVVEDDVRRGDLRILLDPHDDNLGYYVVIPSGPQKSATRLFTRWLKTKV